MTPITRKAVQPLIERALTEDAASRDITSRALLPPGARIRAAIIAKAPGVLAGGPLASWTFQTLDPRLRCVLKRRDGAPLARGQVILVVEGRARSIFAAERTALNLLGHLSGIATLTREFVRRVPQRVAILDTRKTLPGLRALEKYAVRIGGGLNHRSNLSEAILIKTNHLKALRARSSPPRPASDESRGGQSIVHSPQLIQQAIARARREKPRIFVEIEVTNLRELKAALRAKPDAILLDNWSLLNVRRAVAVHDHGLWSMDYRPILEVSGSVTLANVRAIARTGVERISIGRLTHSAPALDVALKVL